MPSLDWRAPNLKVGYRSDFDDIARDFYVPCLEVSTTYDRASGYFTSGALPIIAKGLAHYLDTGGHMRLVCSPVLTEQDADAIERGYLSRSAAAESALIREIGVAAAENLQSTELLSWMISESILDIRVAMPTSGTGVYHEKFGVFANGETDFCAFVGSPNESAQAARSNFEQIAVFIIGQSSRETGRIQGLREQFDRLWDNRTVGLEVVNFPEAARRELLRYRPKSRPVPPSGPRDINVELHEHQRAAIQAWEAAGHKGILEMATGTGKTLTSLAATRVFARSGELILILVPGSDLLAQWEAVIRSRIPGAAVQICGGGSRWRDTLGGFLQGWRIRSQMRELSSHFDSHYVIATLDTASSDNFKRFFKSDSKCVLIVDEAHRAGAYSRRRALDLPLIQKRLGLSATPDRPWDSAGDEVIRELIGDTCFRYSLEDAIGDGFLTPYDYRPQTVLLTAEERDEYAELSSEISRLFIALTTKYPQAGGNMRRIRDVASPDEVQRLELLLFRRADVIKEASGKRAVVAQIAKDSDIKRCLIYCNDEEQVEMAKEVLVDAGRSFALFTSSRLQTDERLTVLRDFEEGRFDFLVSIRCLDEGIDVPGAQHALIVASSKTEREFIQRRGRVLRLATGKELATIHDPIVLPVETDADGYPMRSLSAAEMSIVMGELERARLFAENAENRTEALGYLEYIRQLVASSAGQEVD